MPEKFLHCADVVATLKEMGGERMAEHMTTHLFMQTRLSRSIFHCILQDAFVQMMPPYFPGTGVGRKPFGGKRILPTPLFGGLRILPCKGRPNIYFSEPFRQVFLVLCLDCFKMFLELLFIFFWKDRHAVCLTLAVPDDNLMLGKINVLYPKPNALHESQTAPVKVPCHERLDAGQLREKPVDLFDREYYRKPLGAFGLCKIAERTKGVIKDLIIKEYQRVERLILCIGGVFSHLREVFEVFFDRLGT